MKNLLYFLMGVSVGAFCMKVYIDKKEEIELMNDESITEDDIDNTIKKYQDLKSHYDTETDEIILKKDAKNKKNKNVDYTTFYEDSKNEAELNSNIRFISEEEFEESQKDEIILHYDDSDIDSLDSYNYFNDDGNPIDNIDDLLGDLIDEVESKLENNEVLYLVNDILSVNIKISKTNL